MKQKKYLCGIDEAGRGPLAGPVAVGVVAVKQDFDWSRLSGVGDSKQLSSQVRESLFRAAWQLRKEKEINWRVSMVGARVIDERGIVTAIKLAMSRGLSGLKLAPAETRVLLDGSLFAPSIYSDQTTIIKGDQKEPVIGLASILAKVTRDRYMDKLSEITEYETYAFASHKGYGTKKHREAIRMTGLSDEHRTSFCRKLLI